MRLDKYLKVSRLVKRRTMAKELCDAGRVMVNGRQGKAGTEVKPGDELTINYGMKVLTAVILEVREQVRASEASSLYEVRGEERKGDPL